LHQKITQSQLELSYSINTNHYLEETKQPKPPYTTFAKPTQFSIVEMRTSQLDSNMNYK